MPKTLVGSLWAEVGSGAVLRVAHVGIDEGIIVAWLVDAASGEPRGVYTLPIGDYRLRPIRRDRASLERLKDV